MPFDNKRSLCSTTFTSLPARIVSSSEWSFALLFCLLAATFAYRIQLTRELVTSSIKPFDFNPSPHPVLFLISELHRDLLFSLGSFLMCWLLSRLKLVTRRDRLRSAITVLGVALLQIFFFGVLLVHRSHLRLLFDGQTGFDYSVLREAFSGASFGRVSSSIEIPDILFLVAPLALFWVIPFAPSRMKIWLMRFSSIWIILLVIIPSAIRPSSNSAPDEIRGNPVLFLLSDVSNHLHNRAGDVEADTHATGVIESGLHPTGFLFTNPVRQVKSLPAESTQPWNIIFVIMESVGARYVFDTSRGNPMPMPFLDKLSREGWYLKNHYSSANFSSKAMFSLLSGLYDFFNPETFCMRADSEVPSLYNFVGKNYDSFFVTPGSLSWYFPEAFFKNSGFPEIHSYENLNFKIKEEFHSFGHYIARDEQQTADFFSRRLRQAREPFLGVYISFTAHFPYFENGPQYHVLDEKFGLISRYYNNLNLLDHIIEQFFGELKNKGCLDRTLFVIVGDHGQAFGQHHPNNYMHFRYSYNENLETPALLYQPALFTPRTFTRPTSHVDILPTLLDAMRIPYDPMLLDGESLFANRFKRKYLFFYGLEESVSCLEDSGIKIQKSLKQNKCWAYDLKQDPAEETRLDCSSFQSQLDALRRFTADHDRDLLQYNASLNKNIDFKGRRHPLLHR